MSDDHFDLKIEAWRHDAAEARAKAAGHRKRAGDDPDPRARLRKLKLAELLEHNAASLEEHIAGVIRRRQVKAGFAAQAR